ncbi:uncharacterized protein LOC129599048 [Paramacrobiotus metropolitanus]|uniref:uncharacterized protein LOC129599048 n=1 Tax=Paramacrobiotus metropolitanus TaxID=2943436 RepID=UPI0024461ADF|nr:uncharacterized protein LOC129599048 [Paramacrobiotus metropolitanus]
MASSLPLCPQDGFPSCANCKPGTARDSLVMTQCCFAHNWAWVNNQSLRDVYPYNLYLDPVTNTGAELQRDIHLTEPDRWHSDPCTGEPADSIPNGPYIPWRKRKPQLIETVIDSQGKTYKLIQ